jgi:hypothetical protein
MPKFVPARSTRSFHTASAELSELQSATILSCFSPARPKFSLAQRPICSDCFPERQTEANLAFRVITLRINSRSHPSPTHLTCQRSRSIQGTEVFSILEPERRHIYLYHRFKTSLIVACIPKSFEKRWEQVCKRLINDHSPQEILSKTSPSK